MTAIATATPEVAAARVEWAAGIRRPVQRPGMEATQAAGAVLPLDRIRAARAALPAAAAADFRPSWLPAANSAEPAVSNGFSGGGGAGLGGAVFIEATSNTTSRIVASTFGANTVVAGGGGEGGDGGSGAGGAIFLHTGELTLSFSTLIANGATGGNVQPLNAQNGGNGLGGGIYVHSAATLTIDHTVVSGNSVTAGTTTNGSNGSAIDADLFGAMSSSGYNLVTTRGDSTGYVGSDLPNSESPNLGPLQNNGGPTQTYLPQPGSPLIDADTSANCNGGFATDQRGDPRPFGVGCDIGAVEVNDIIFRNGFELFD